MPVGMLTRFVQERLVAAMQAATGGEAPPIEPVFAEIYNQNHARA